jgi:hypothetical protein
MWVVEHIDPETNKRKKKGRFESFHDAWTCRANLVDGKIQPGCVKIHDGEVVVDICSARCCSRKNLPVEDYAPRTSESKLEKFIEAVRRFQSDPTDLHLKSVEKSRAKNCSACRNSKHTSDRNPETVVGEIAAALRKRQASGVCIDCGTTRWIEFDNVVSEKERRILFLEGKVAHLKHHGLGDPAWWACNGGIDAWNMECNVVVERCRGHHRLQTTGSAGARIDPDTLPPEVVNESVVDNKLYQKRKNAKTKWPRYMYNDSLKRAVGGCENLDCPCDGPGSGKCTEGVEPAFDWEHTNAKAKKSDISDLCIYLSPDLSKEEWVAEINAELERGQCRLLCANCHALKTSNRIIPRYGKCAFVWRVE